MGTKYYILSFLMFFISIGSFAQTKEKDIILIVASYNPDTQRMSTFINDFEKEISKLKLDYRILIEDMACKNIGSSAEWMNRLQNLLNRYDKERIKGVILLGQEAFATFLTLDEYSKDIPFFACFASANGIHLPVNNETSVDMISWAKGKGTSGGVLNKYNVAENIKLIGNLFPDTKNIAFVSDNTYGGISLLALVRKEMENFPDLNLITIDSRHLEQNDIAKKMGELPENTAILLGTWRVDKDGMYMLSNSLNDLATNKKVPIFSLTGTGIGSIAIGGYVPDYKSSAGEIAQQIKNFYSKSDTLEFLTGGCNYTFNKSNIESFEIRESHLPKNSIIVDDSKLIIQKYRMYIYTACGIIILLILFSIWLYKTYRRNKLLQKELIIAKEQAEESDRLKTAFLANMGHEIRTPLNAIVGFSNLLCEEPFPEESKEEYATIISKNSDLLLTLISDILDISKMEAGKMNFVYRNEDVATICEQVMMTTEHLSKKNVKYQFIRGDEDAMISTDTQRTSQVLINLITNAIKFTDEGSVTLSYEVKRSEGKVLFIVTDTGCGVPEDLKLKIFNRFEKLNNMKQGTGLGLAISKQIATHLGGDIWLDTTYTGGARFLFSHPMMKQTTTPEEN